MLQHCFAVKLQKCFVYSKLHLTLYQHSVDKIKIEFLFLAESFLLNDVDKSSRYDHTVWGKCFSNFKTALWEG